MSEPDEQRDSGVLFDEPDESLEPHLQEAAVQQQEIDALQRKLEVTIARADRLRSERASTVNTIAALAIANSSDAGDDTALLHSIKTPAVRHYGTAPQPATAPRIASVCRRCAEAFGAAACSATRRGRCWRIKCSRAHTIARSREQQLWLMLVGLLALCLGWRVLAWGGEQEAVSDSSHSIGNGTAVSANGTRVR